MKKIRIFSPESIDVPRKAGTPEPPVECPKVNEYVQKKMPDVPIVDSHGCTVILAEVLVRLGLRHSKKAYPKPRELFKCYLRKN